MPGRVEPRRFWPGERVVVCYQGANHAGQVAHQPRDRLGRLTGITLVMRPQRPHIRLVAVPTALVRRRDPIPFTQARCPRCGFEVVFRPAVAGWAWTHPADRVCT